MNPLKHGGLNVINSDAKCKSVLVSNLFSFLNSSHSCIWHHFARYHFACYYLGRRLAFLDSRWKHFSANNLLNTFFMSEFYKTSFECLKQSLASGLLFDSTKKCYVFFCVKDVEPPWRIQYHWTSLLERDFNWQTCGN